MDLGTNRLAPLMPTILVDCCIHTLIFSNCMAHEEFHGPTQKGQSIMRVTC